MISLSTISNPFDSFLSFGEEVDFISKEYIGVYDYDKMPVINLLKGKQTVKHFQLEKACMIEVIVMDDEGKPLKDVRVIATSLADGRKREIGRRLNALKTDKKGYSLQNALRAQNAGLGLGSRERNTEK